MKLQGFLLAPKELYHQKSILHNGYNIDSHKFTHENSFELWTKVRYISKNMASILKNVKVLKEIERPMRYIALYKKTIDYYEMNNFQKFLFYLKGVNDYCFNGANIKKVVFGWDRLKKNTLLEPWRGK